MRKIILHVTSGLLLALIPSILMAEETQNISQSPDQDDYYSHLTISILPAPNGGQEIFMRKEGNKWILLKPGQRPSLQDEGTEKLIYQNAVIYLATNFNYKNWRGVCTRNTTNGLDFCPCSSSDENRQKVGYHFCTSNFKRAKPNTLKNGMAMSQGNLIIGALSAALTSIYEIDVEGIRTALREVGFEQFLQDARNREQLERYRNEFAKATSSASLTVFISKYQSIDPDMLVPIAMKKKEAALAYENNEKQRLIDDKVRETRALALFREALKNGDESNCGPVIEIKGELAKVYFPVANYGNEHWLRKNLLYPAGHGCRFVNGGYVPTM